MANSQRLDGNNPAPNSGTAALPHILGILGILGSLIGWLVVKDKSPFCDQEGKKAMNFQLILFVAAIVCMVLALIPGIGFLFRILSLVVWITGLVFSILAYMAVSKGQIYTYPVSAPVFK